MPFCTDLWSDQILPRVEAKPFGLPNLRTVLLTQHQTVGRVELLTEVSKTDSGKFYIVVFQRFVKPKKSARTSALNVDSTESLETGPSNLFDDIT